MESGTRIGPYEIKEPLGKGGMGEVYRAHDTKLIRDVAIKVLPTKLADDAERLARLEREARLLASLNHPNIGSIYGLEETEDEGRPALVLEFVEGPTLQDRIEAGPIPIGEALSIARQIAEALKAAHERGVMHRDLKPANVKVGGDGTVKVLDFGLAKAYEADGVVAEISPNLSVSPTLAAATEPGMILGTPTYMSPEQARGKPVDKRTDIWAFGALLYEMLVGESAFSGETPSDIVAAILRAEPEWEALPDGTPPQVVSLLRHCLTKDVRRRLPDIVGARRILNAIVRGNGEAARVGGAAASGAHSQWAKRAADALEMLRQPPAAGLGVVATLILAAGIGGFLASNVMRTGPGPTATPQPGRFTQLTSDRAEELYPSLSPDGRFLVYSSPAAGNWDVYLLRVGGTNPINLTADSPSGDTQPSYSSEGRYIAFRSERDGGGIFVMEATGENVRRVSDDGYHPDWSPDGSRIVYSAATAGEDPLARGNVPSALRIVPVDGDEHRELTAGDAVQPAWSPSGDRIAYWGVHQGGQRDIWTIPATGGEPTQVTSHGGVDWNPAWAPDGSHLYFVSDRGGSMNIWRVAIDEASGRVRSAPQPVTTPSAFSQHVRLAASGGTFVYVRATRRVNLQAMPFDPEAGAVSGPARRVNVGSQPTKNPDLSPDGEWFVFDSLSLQAGQEDLFVVASDGSRIRRLTNDVYKDRGARWSPDGSKIAFLSDRSGRYECWLVNRDGSGLQRLSSTGDARWAQAPIWAPDGKRLACNMSSGSPIILDTDTGGPASPLRELPPPPSAQGGLFFAWTWSHGDKLAGWLESGIYTYSLERDEFQRHTDVGERPRWLPDGRRLLFQTEDIHVVDVTTGATRTVYSPAPDRLQSFGLSRDGRLLYVAVQVTEADVWMASPQ